MIEYRLNEEGFLVEVGKETKENNMKNANANLNNESTEFAKEIVAENEIEKEIDNVNENSDNTNEVFKEITDVPAKRGFWSNLKTKLFKDVRIIPEIELTPYENKVFKEVHDFWTQDIRKLFK